jgi:hypothetical protein
MRMDARRKINPFSVPNWTKEVRLDEYRNIFIGYIVFVDFLNPKHRFSFIKIYDV